MRLPDSEVVMAHQLKEGYLITILSLRHLLYQGIRKFFTQKGYIEVETPALVPSPGIDPYIDALAVEGGGYLATSPELQMKRLLGMGMKKIFQFARAFRKGEQGDLHNPEFSLLEWYHAGKDYRYLMDEVEALVRLAVRILHNQGFDHLILPSHPFPRYTIDGLFQTHAGWLPSAAWDEERFFLDLVEKIEPSLISEPAVIIYDFPAPVASLARLKPGAPHLSERFELYMDGLEIANAFSELTDPKEQKQRLLNAQKRRKEIGKEAYPIDKKFIDTLEKGLLPASAGIALGIERLIMAITGEHRIDRVMAFSQSLL